MAQISAIGGMLFPFWNGITASSGLISPSNVTLDAAGEKLSMVGRVYMEGRAASKTIDTTGSSAISFRCPAITFAHASTSLTVGIQDVDAAAGPAGRGDGTFDVSAVLTTAASPPSGSAWNTKTPTAGTKTLSHGQHIAVVFDLTARGGADSFLVTCSAANANAEPYVNENLGGAGYANTSNKMPNVVLTMSDGTLATIDYTHPFSSGPVETFSDATNPDERGMIFQVPWDCKIDGLFFAASFTDANTDGTFALWADPLGTPASLASITVLGEQIGGGTSNRFRFYNLDSEVSLTKNTSYCVAFKATGSSNVSLNASVLGAAGHRVLYSGGTTLNKATRNGGTGAFTAEVTPVTLYHMGVRISSFDDGTGAGSGGMLVHPGMNGRLG